MGTIIFKLLRLPHQLPSRSVEGCLRYTEKSIYIPVEARFHYGTTRLKSEMVENISGIESISIIK
jgi:hypothetical protein